MHRAPTMTTDILSSLYGTDFSHSGAPYKLCPRFPSRNTPVLAWSMLQIQMQARQASPALQQLLLLPACACTSPDCKKYCRSWGAATGLEALYQSCPFSF